MEIFTFMRFTYIHFYTRGRRLKLAELLKLKSQSGYHYGSGRRSRFDRGVSTHLNIGWKMAIASGSKCFTCCS